ncbi:hypothetical protein BD560DRAFT_439037 [Blakeslea trispora]|nr:hypothetical protein BD560DRAFT_439037 [Blakeslea trispora]
MLTPKADASQKSSASSKWANAEFDPKNAKERIEHELKLLRVRKQAIDVKKTPSTTAVTSRVKKTQAKRGASVKKQKKIARALMVADKEEKRMESQQVKAEKRKIGKQLWD